MNLQEANKQSLKEFAVESENQETKITLRPHLKEALVKKGVEISEEDKDELTKEIEDKLDETKTIHTARSLFKKSLPGISK